MNRHNESDCLLFLGDSLTYGYGLARNQPYPHLVENLLLRDGLKVRSINAGVNGDTSSGALNRLAPLLRHKPDHVIIALGANDMLRCVPTAQVESNLNRLIESVGPEKTILLGMRAHPFYGWEYMNAFDSIYPRLASVHGIPYLPFFIEEVVGRPELNLPDGVHPNPRGHELIANKVHPFLKGILKRGQNGNPIGRSDLGRANQSRI